MVFAKALARRAVLAWEGVGDADGKPIDPSPEAIDALLDIWSPRHRPARHVHHARQSRSAARCDQA